MARKPTLVKHSSSYSINPPTSGNSPHSPANLLVRVFHSFSLLSSVDTWLVLQFYRSHSSSYERIRSHATDFYTNPSGCYSSDIHRRGLYSYTILRRSAVYLCTVATTKTRTLNCSYFQIIKSVPSTLLYLCSFFANCSEAMAPKRTAEDGATRAQDASQVSSLPSPPPTPFHERVCSLIVDAKDMA